MKEEEFTFSSEGEEEEVFLSYKQTIDLNLTGATSVAAGDDNREVAIQSFSPSLEERPYRK